MPTSEFFFDQIEDELLMATCCELIEALQINWGVRISEALSITDADIADGENIHIHASKYSNDRYLNDPDWIQEVISSIPIRQGKPLFPISYAQYSHWLLKRYQFGTPPGHENRRTTHHFRAEIIQEKYANGETIEEIAEWIGHKSTTSTELYL